MPSQAAITRDNEHAEDIVKQVLYLSEHTLTFRCPDRMFFDDAMPAYDSMINQVLDNSGRRSRDIDTVALTLPKIEGVIMFPGEGKNRDGYTLIGCRPMSYDAKKRLFLAGGAFFKAPLGMNVDVDVRNFMTPLAKILQIRRVDIDPDGRGISRDPAYMARIVRLGDQWMVLSPGETIKDRSLAWMGYSLAVGMTVTMATAWTVSLKFDLESPGLRFVTDPTGIREFFRFRDVPEGKARKAALVNWVTDHWRALRNSPEDEVYVREHLRGARTFSWHGLNSSIHIPDLDVKKEALVVAERKRMPAHEAIRRARRAK